MYRWNHAYKQYGRPCYGICMGKFVFVVNSIRLKSNAHCVASHTVHSFCLKKLLAIKYENYYWLRFKWKKECCWYNECIFCNSLKELRKFYFNKWILEMNGRNCINMISVCVRLLPVVYHKLFCFAITNISMTKLMNKKK